jgi:hypothetical protein
MAWRNGYFYRTQRIGSKFRDVYYGTGLLGWLAADRQKKEQEKRAAAQVAARRQRKAEERAFKAARKRAKKADAILAKGLQAAGFHRPYRKPWMRTAEAAMQNRITTAAEPTQDRPWANGEPSEAGGRVLPDRTRSRGRRP